MSMKITMREHSWIILLFLILCVPMSGMAGPPVPPVPPAPPLPGLVVPASPSLVLIPGTVVYFPPDVNSDLVFYHGFWYRPYQGRWYRAAHFNGPWGFVALRKVPRVLINLPAGYRSSPGRERIPYGRLKRNWRAWERDRHWDKVENRGEERREREHGDGEKGLGHGLRKGHAR